MDQNLFDESDFLESCQNNEHVIKFPCKYYHTIRSKLIQIVNDCDYNDNNLSSTSSESSNRTDNDYNFEKETSDFAFTPNDEVHILPVPTQRKSLLKDEGKSNICCDFCLDVNYSNTVSECTCSTINHTEINFQKKKNINNWSSHCYSTIVKECKNDPITPNSNNQSHQQLHQEENRNEPITPNSNNQSHQQLYQEEYRNDPITPNSNNQSHQQLYQEEFSNQVGLRNTIRDRQQLLTKSFLSEEMKHNQTISPKELNNETENMRDREHLLENYLYHMKQSIEMSLNERVCDLSMKSNTNEEDLSVVQWDLELPNAMKNLKAPPASWDVSMLQNKKSFDKAVVSNGLRGLCHERRNMDPTKKSDVYNNAPTMFFNISQQESAEQKQSRHDNEVENGHNLVRQYFSRAIDDKLFNKK